MNAPVISPGGEPGPALRQEVNSNPEYLRCVERLAQETDMIVGQDIHASNGIKLIAKGSRVDKGTWEKLTRHTLTVPLESVLVAAEAVDVLTLARDADQLLAAEPALAALVNRTGDPLAWKSLIGTLRLPTPLAFRMKVMREQKQDMYQHALRLAVLAHSLGLQLKWPRPQLADLVLAALCHDFGEMHTDPAILEGSHPICGDALRFIHVHPVTGYVILCQTQEVPRAVALGVLQHHERLDGSGYPHGLSGDRLQPIARALAVAELYDVVARRGGVRRLKVILSVDQAQFDPAIVRALRALLPAFEPADSMSPDTLPALPLTPRLNRLQRLTAQWDALKPVLPASEPLLFIRERVEQIQINAWRAGIAPGFIGMFQPEEADHDTIRELHLTLDEIDRLLMALAAEIQRRIAPGHPRWPELMPLCEHLAGAAAPDGVDAHAQPAA